VETTENGRIGHHMAAGHSL